MKLVVVRDKDSVHIVQKVDELHAFLVSQQEAGGTHGVGSQRRVGDDRHAGKRILTGISGVRA